MKWRANQEKRDAGFSLFELLLVLVIIAMMSMAALPSFEGALETTRAQRSVGELRSLSLAQRLYRLETGEFAQRVETLQKAELLPSGAQGETKGFDFLIRKDALGKWRLVARRIDSTAWAGEFSLDQMGSLRGELRGPGDARVSP